MTHACPREPAHPGAESTRPSHRPTLHLPLSWARPHGLTHSSGRKPTPAARQRRLQPVGQNAGRRISRRTAGIRHRHCCGVALERAGSDGRHTKGWRSNGSIRSTLSPLPDQHGRGDARAEAAQSHVEPPHVACIAPPLALRHVRYRAATIRRLDPRLVRRTVQTADLGLG
jgi:hypothetical protein